MKKVGFILIAAVIVPSMILAWLSLRAQHDQELVLERQQWLLYQGVVDAVASELNNRLIEHQSRFAQTVNTLVADGLSATTCASFDQQLRTNWSFAKVGFAVSSNGLIGCPTIASGGRAQTFLEENGRFLGNVEPAQVFFNSQKLAVNTGVKTPANTSLKANSINRKTQPSRGANPDNTVVRSKFNPAQAEFHQLVGDSSEGTIARFVNDSPNVMFWLRPESEPDQIYGSQIDLTKITDDISQVIRVPKEHEGAIALALLNDRTTPVTLRPAGFVADWGRPFVAAEISETLPHWEVAAYLVDPGSLARTASASRTALGWMVVLLVMAIAVGGWLVLVDVRRQLLIARQKTDFVSSVTHELKTPLTSIRMFSELLAAKEELPDEKRRSYVSIINNESARLTRLINNVLDFARLDRRENKLELTQLDLLDVVREVWEAHAPQLEEAGFTTSIDLPTEPFIINGNHDAITQIILNLLSNAEKFSRDRRDIRVEVLTKTAESRNGELRVLDRGPGVPTGESEKIFEQFHRADDSLASGVGGVGLGLTLARQLARAHGGGLQCHPRDGGGSVFVFTFPVCRTTQKEVS